MRADYPLNSRVYVHITKVIPPGLRGCVAGEQPALIRRREIAWGEPLPGEMYVGQTRKAVVVGYNAGYGELELSLRLAEHDPWDAVPERYPVGAEVVGRVIGLIERGAFVEIEPGVEAFLHLSDLLSVETGAIEDWLWIDDRVCALVTRLDGSRRRLRLSVQQLVEYRETTLQRHGWTAGRADAPGSATIAELLPTQTRLRLPLLEDKALPSEPRLRVLWVEDDATYAAGLERLLRRNGCQITQAQNGARALACARESTFPFDLILIDWSLPGLCGNELVQGLVRISPASHLALVVETGITSAYPELQAALRDTAVDVMDKGDGEALAAGLVATLHEIRTAHGGAPAHRALSVPSWMARPDGTQQPDTTEEDYLLSGDSRPSLASVLERLMQHNGADSALLLQYDPGRRRLAAIVAAGIPFPIEQASPDLIHSPLKDILQDGIEVCERVTPRSRKFGRLLDLAPFQGFLGVPILSFGYDGYGLILLKGQGSFGPQERLEARMAAFLIAGMLQESHLSQSLLPWQAQHLVGRLVNSAIHEINNKLGAIEFLIQDVREGLQELARWPEKAQDVAFMHDLQRAAEQIATARAEASALRDQYLSLTANDEVQPVDLCALVGEVIQVLRPEARRHNLLLTTAHEANLPPVSAHPSQLRQVLLNLALNAIQQMSGLRRHGRIEITCSHQPDAGVLEVRFADQGPGIHRQLWERVFDFGFTTKKGGGGLGLTISRQAAAGMGGRLYVGDSLMLWGTTFLLELPVGGTP